MAAIEEEEGGTSDEKFMDRVDRRSAAQSGALSRGGIDLAGRLPAGVAPVALSSPARDPGSRRGADMSAAGPSQGAHYAPLGGSAAAAAASVGVPPMNARLGPIAGLLMGILLAAGCASTSGLSTQATLNN